MTTSQPPLAALTAVLAVVCWPNRRGSAPLKGQYQLLKSRHHLLERLWLGLLLLVGLLACTPAPEADAPTTNPTEATTRVPTPESLSADAQGPNAPATTTERPLAGADQPGAITEPLLWFTQSDTSKVAMLGSIHLANADIYPLDPRIEQAYEQSDVLVLEVSLDDETVAEAGAKLLAEGLLPKGETLVDQLEPELARQLTAKLTELRLPLSAVNSFKPWLASTVIMIAEMERAGFKGELGIDSYFFRKAEAKQQTVLALESVEDQVEAIGTLESAGANETLRMTLEVDSADTMKQMLDVWQRGDVKALDRSLDDLRKFPKAFHHLFTRRNQHMAKEIDALLKTRRSYFVIVGAAHLVGEGSVLDELARRGHASTRVR